MSHATQPTDLNFDTPTPARLRRKMVDWRDVMLRLMSEFPKAELSIVVPFIPFDLLNFRASAVSTEPPFERAVYRRARQLEQRAYFRNADIKFGLRDGKGRWWQDAAA
jgi:hypothetical protein